MSPGDYDYSYIVNSLTLALDTSDEVGASYFATDSRYSDPLWSLGISAQGVLNSNADLVIDFQSNPILGLDDSLIDSEVRAAFSVSSGTAVLDDFELFHTTYLVDQPITYAEGVNAGVEPIREPSALDLLASGLALCAAVCGFRERPKRHYLHRALASLPSQPFRNLRASPPLHGSWEQEPLNGSAT